MQPHYNHTKFRKRLTQSKTPTLHVYLRQDNYFLYVLALATDATRIE